MKISVVIPAHNEEKIIGKTLTSVVTTLDKSKIEYEIIAVDDNSSDQTYKIIKKTAKKYTTIKPVQKVSEKKGPTGFGSALSFGFKHASGDVVIPFMGDLSDDPGDILKLVEKIGEGYDVVCGSRFIPNSKVIGYPLTKLIAHKIFNRFFSFIFGLGLNDFTNAFKAYRRKVLNSIELKSKGFEFNAELLLKAHIQGFKITEVPVGWRGRKKGISKFGQSFKLLKVGLSYVKVALKLYFEKLLTHISSLVRQI